MIINILKIHYKINLYIKNITWKTIANLELSDLEIIWRDLWLYEYTEQEQKQRFLDVLNSIWLNLNTIQSKDFK